MGRGRRSNTRAHEIWPLHSGLREDEFSVATFDFIHSAHLSGEPDEAGMLISLLFEVIGKKKNMQRITHLGEQ